MNTETGKVYQTPAEIQRAQQDGEPLIELPHKPTPGCHVCKGTGKRRSWGTTFRYGACPKCYPGHPCAARAFSDFLAHGPVAKESAIVSSDGPILE